MSQAWLIYNPGAGRFPAYMLVERAAQVLQQAGWDIHLVVSTNSRDLQQLCRQAAERGCEAVFVAGGDGSVGHAVAGLLGTDTALGVLPAGTANVLAQELGLPILSWTSPRALEHAAACLAHVEACTVDVGVCNGHPFLLWAGGGLDGFVVHRIEPRARWEKHLGVVGYAASAIRAAVNFRGTHLQVTADGQRVEGDFLLAVVSNIRSYAGGIATLSPDARLDDGQMDLWLFSGAGLRDTVRQAADLLRGQHLHSERALRLPIREVELVADTPLHFQLDGEPMVMASHISVQVLPRALRLLVPANAVPRLMTIQRKEGSLA